MTKAAKRYEDLRLETFRIFNDPSSTPVQKQIAMERLEKFYFNLAPIDIDSIQPMVVEK
jgi:hypothetical protein